MAQHSADLLGLPAICTALQRAWADSHPGITGGHEEGGFILRDSSGSMSVARWPQGVQNRISLPPHQHCKIGEMDIVATFHTHPNTADTYLQEPSETDRRAVQDDPDLKGVLYRGEFVISEKTIYVVTPDGQIGVVGKTAEIFAQG